MKTAEREQARVLRGTEGRSIKEIASLLGVAASSVSTWVRDIELTPDQLRALGERNPALNAQRNGARTRAARARAVRARAQAEGRAAARIGDPLHAAGCMLFWAEGSKHRNTVQLSNSDTELVSVFLTFLRAVFAVDDARLRVQCNLHADDEAAVRRVENHWLRVLGLPRSCLTKSIVNSVSRGSQRKRTNMLPWGTCRLTLHDTAVVQHLYGAIQEYGRFDRREWLDCPPRAPAVRQAAPADRG